MVKGNKALVGQWRGMLSAYEAIAPDGDIVWREWTQHKGVH